MARKKTSMKKIKEILRLADEGFSQREIAAAASVGKTTVQEVLAKAGKAGFEWKQLKVMTEMHIVKILYSDRGSERNDSSSNPLDWATIHRQLSKKGVTIKLL